MTPAFRFAISFAFFAILGLCLSKAPANIAATVTQAERLPTQW